VAEEGPDVVYHLAVAAALPRRLHGEVLQILNGRRTAR
jgi:hypothetical protein